MELVLRSVFKESQVFADLIIYCSIGMELKAQSPCLCRGSGEPLKDLGWLI